MNEKFLEVGDVMQILGISRSAAYKLMRQINSELEKKGYIVIRGKVSRKYFEERIYGINSKDYGISAMEKLAKDYDVEKVLNVASYAHMYVFEFDGKIVGTGSISSFWGSETESILLCIFVLPKFHGKGIGKNYKYIRSR